MGRTFLSRKSAVGYRGRETIRNYEKKVIGQADDFSDANGVTVLTFDQAQAKARELMKRREFAEAGVVEGPYTVRRAVDDYLHFLETGGKEFKGPQVRAYAHIVPTLGNIENRIVDERSPPQVVVGPRSCACAQAYGTRQATEVQDDPSERSQVIGQSHVQHFARGAQPRL